MNFAIRGQATVGDVVYVGRVSFTGTTLRVLASDGTVAYEAAAVSAVSTGRRRWTVTLSDESMVTVEGKGCGCSGGR